MMVVILCGGGHMWWVMAAHRGDGCLGVCGSGSTGIAV